MDTPVGTFRPHLLPVTVAHLPAKTLDPLLGARKQVIPVGLANFAYSVPC
jgi:hypothetical protein